MSDNNGRHAAVQALQSLKAEFPNNTDHDGYIRGYADGYADAAEDIDTWGAGYNAGWAQGYTAAVANGH